MKSSSGFGFSALGAAEKKQKSTSEKRNALPRTSNVFHRPARHHLSPPSAQWFVTVSVFALSAALFAVPARADCTRQGDTQTCTGTLGIIDFSESNTNSSQTLTLKIEDATNDSFSGSTSEGSAIWTLSAEASEDGQAAANVNLDVDLKDFKLNTNNELGVHVITTSQSGKSYADSENEGKEDRTGRNGGVGGAGGTATATISGLDVLDDSIYFPENIEIVSIAGNGGTGEKGESTNGDKGTGGAGGAGGRGGTVNITLEDSDFENSEGVFFRSISGLGGVGGEGHTVDKGIARGGIGGNGGQGGSVNVTVSGASFGSTKTGVAVRSEARAGGTGGYSDGSDKGKSYGGAGGVGGNSGQTNVTVENTTFTSGRNVYIFNVGGQGGDGGESKSHSNDSYGGEGGVGGTGGTITAVISGITVGKGVNQPGVHNIDISSHGGNGGKGAYAYSEKDQNAYGGAGGKGGYGGRINLTVKNSQITAGDGLYAAGLGGVGGHGGDGDTSNHNSHGGDGGDGGLGGAVILEVSDFSIGDASDLLTSGIVATSQGGTGGKGGEAQNGVFANSYGGKGGVGGDGGAINIRNTVDGTTGQLSVNVASSAGLLAESIAGNGGKGGEGHSGGTGGDGGEGGHGGGVTISIAKTGSGALSAITTEGDNSAGLVARSYGGAGGDGGTGKGLGTGGGAGGGSGSAGGLNVSYTGEISTNGTLSDGILAQSVGGFAGDAANSDGIIAYGASSESAGSGGGITFQYDGADGAGITTKGDDSDGIFVQSLGGGGGKAGSTSGLIALSGDEDGSSGGDGGALGVTLSGAINTVGTRSRGLVAQSLGGTGGDGGSARGLTSIGGTGANGGSGAKISAISTADITTTGDDSIAVLVQSIGGGGGAAGSTDGIVAIGGNGGKGAVGGLINTTIGGTINTSGTSADGVVLQSIGGSGGLGSNTLALGSGLSVAIAGNGGAGGNGGEIQALTTQSGSSVTTRGDNARGVAAMSIGGGGGHGGNALSVSGNLGPSLSVAVGGSGGAGGAGSAVNLDLRGEVTTYGDNAAAVSALSVGGGGGSAGTTVSASGATTLGAVAFAVGGSGGGAGDGGAVKICRGISDAQANASCSSDGSNGEGLVQTSGDGAMGIYASSIGGSGGQSGATISGTVSSTASVGIAIGGKGGRGGNGAAVTVYSSGDVTTTGAASSALVASSIGGSGGNVHVVGAIGAVGDNGLNIGVGAQGGKAGSSGAVSLTSTDTISTNGAISAGIQAMSQAGTGGSGSGVFTGTGISTGSAGVSIGSQGGSGGNAGAVDVSWNGTKIQTQNEQSPGIFAMSGAGAGGNAGLSVSGNGASLLSTSVSIGGKGGGGGQAGSVTVTVQGEIDTAGFMSDGISAISQGGNGGRGGMSFTGTGISQGTADLAIGGDGGTGGNSKTTSVSTLAGSSITTNGPSAAGINALSLGGAGGQGGAAVDTGMNVDATDGEFPVVDADFVFGGEGAQGGTSGEAYVHNSAAILTQDFNSVGIQAQSIAGSGGSGGMAISGTLNAASPTQMDASLTYGGSGGAGGTAGEARIEVVADITTTGDNSSGILAQSIGGSGGAGGMTYNILSNVKSGGTLGLSAYVTLGGGGGSGGKGGEASVNNGSLITTSGTSSSGIYAQSIGGSGGSGGFGGTGIYNFGEQQTTSNKSITMNLNKTIGGKGGNGAVGGKVDVLNQGGGHITTGGSGAYGIFAQSVGGNGGDGGLSSNFSQSLALPSSQSDSSDTKKVKVSAAATIKIGGDGGTGADAGDVSVNNQAQIKTAGDVAHGIMAQSVGGGGGVGGSAASNADSFVTRSTGSVVGQTIGQLRSKYNVTNLKSDFGTFNLSVGGTGGAAGTGGASSVTNDRPITTSGTNAYGIFSQSIGGGGGSGGEAASITDTYALQLGGNGGGGGDGGETTIVNSGAVSTSGYGSTALFAQSIGAGGGNTGSKTGFGAIEDVTLAIGGKGGVSGGGGAVNVTYSSGTITTAAEQSSGIFAQSVGGGGGSHFGGIGDLSADVTHHEDSVGGVEKSNGNGGAVTIDSAANITTGPTTPGSLNAASMGIFAQSVGGGGGYSGSMILGDHDRIGANVRSSSSSASGDGGAVTVTQSGSITTTGDNSVGLFAQSVGGGGGVQGTLDKRSTEGAYVGSFGGVGSAGPVQVYTSGNIQTSGAAAHGIFAQYAGGSSSNANNPDMENTVIVNPMGDVVATGAGAHALHIENQGAGVQNVSISIGDGALINGGSKQIYENALDGAGVYLHSSKNSTLGNAGTIKAVSGVAIHNFGGGNLTLNNNGTVTGDILGPCQPDCTSSQGTEDQVVGVSLPTLSNIYVDNHELGVLNTGENYHVARLRNWGYINVGQEDTVSGTHITGDFIQHAGQLTFDLNMMDIEADLLTVGGEADLSGTLAVNVTHASKHPDGIQTIKLLEASGGLDATELEVKPSVVARFRLKTRRDTQLHLGYNVDYANDALLQALNENQSGLTSYFDSLYQIGELDDELATALIGISTTDDYARLMNALGPELATTNGLTALNQTLSFADSLFSCPNVEQGNVWADDGQCGYVTFSANRLNRDATGGASGFSQNGVRIGAGGQMLLENGIAIGGALAYDSSSLTTDAGASSESDAFTGGLSVKRFVDNWEFGVGAYASLGSLDNSRNIGETSASGTQDQWVSGAELRAGYGFNQGSWVFKPRMDLGITHFGGSSYSETGSDAALDINTSSETFTYLRPALEVKGSFLTAGGTEIRPNAVFSVTQYLGNTSFDATARLANSVSSVAPVNWQTEIDSTQFDISAGLTVMSGNGISFDISAFGHLTENERDYGGMVRVNIPF